MEVIDTLGISKRLQGAKLNAEAADAIAEILKDIDQKEDNTVAKQVDLLATQAKVDVLKAELTVVKWMVSGIGFGILILIIEQFLF